MKLRNTAPILYALFNDHANPVLMIMIKAVSGFDDTDKGLSRPQPLQAAGFDVLGKGLLCPFFQAFGLESVKPAGVYCLADIRHQLIIKI